MNLVKIGEAISRLNKAANQKGKSVCVDWIESGLKPDDYVILSAVVRGPNGHTKTVYGRELRIMDYINTLPNVYVEELSNV